MTDERMALLELVEKAADADLVREMLAFAADSIIDGCCQGRAHRAARALCRRLLAGPPRVGRASATPTQGSWRLRAEGATQAARRAVRT